MRNFNFIAGIIAASFIFMSIPVQADTDESVDSICTDTKIQFNTNLISPSTSSAQAIFRTSSAMPKGAVDAGQEGIDNIGCRPYLYKKGEYTYACFALTNNNPFDVKVNVDVTFRGASDEHDYGAVLIQSNWTNIIQLAVRDTKVSSFSYEFEVFDITNCDVKPANEFLKTPSTKADGENQKAFKVQNTCDDYIHLPRVYALFIKGQKDLVACEYVTPISYNTYTKEGDGIAPGTDIKRYISTKNIEYDRVELYSDGFIIKE